MKAIVTGGAGFVGSHLCDKLLKEGLDVLCIDNLITGSLDNIKHLRNNPKFYFYQLDVINDLPKELVADQIYHLASPASPNQNSPKSYHTLAFETMQVNTIGTWKLAQRALECHSKFLFASTSESYGDPLEHPQKETYRGNVSTTGPRAVYDEAKRFGETITSAFVRSKGLDGRIIRIFNTYGPRMAPDDGRAVTEFIYAALDGKQIPIFGDGKQTRSFCYVSDLVDGIYKAMNEDSTKGEVFNLGNPGEFQINELAKLIVELTGSESKIEKVRELPEDDPLQRMPDITKAKTRLNWEPQISLKEGLQKYINFLKQS